MESTAHSVRVYKTNRQIMSIDDLPVPSSQRIHTDLFCTVCTSIFAIIMFIASISFLHIDNLNLMTYPTDQQGRHCTLDNKYFNYLYFTSLQDPAKRLCLAECPTGIEEKLNCWPTDQLSCLKNSNVNFQISIYQTVPTQTNLGLFCEPKDPVLKNKVLQNAHLLQMYDFTSAYRSLGISALSSLGIGLISIVLFLTVAGCMTYTSIAMGGLGCICIALLLIFNQSEILAVYKVGIIIFSIVLSLIGLIMIWSLFTNQNQIRLSISYLNSASKCFKQFPQLVCMIFVFLLLVLALTVLIGFQILAAWSHSSLKFTSESIYYQLTGTFPIIMTIINAIQYIWGLCFLKECFNFILSGTTSNWYFNDRHSISIALRNLFKFHWGSVAGGSFLLNFLYPFDILYDFIKPSQSNQQGNQSFANVCCCCERILDLARTQAMTYINIVGSPYCNSSRECQKIAFVSSIFEGNQSINRYVRIGAHVFLSSIATVIAYFYMTANGQASVLALCLSFIINIFILTYFICLITDISDSLLFCTLLQNYLTGKEQSSLNQNYQNKANQLKRIARPLFSAKEGYQVVATEH